MKKLIALFLSLVFVLALVGCGKAEPSNLRVYSFSGPSNDNPNYIIQVGNVFGFIISIENVL